ncbi:MULTISPECIES: DUF2231 domain-containing protein [unclassified Sphingomonas]|uniref:DUF2231 domain-containing protein n=1 Tax=unclassified Sphingomonas TaxID=196159 RepID=UPI001F56CDAB|nr:MULTISPECIES: DUF2231 domain-containing protein [unclassified Sphingomonas]
MAQQDVRDMPMASAPHPIHSVLAAFPLAFFTTAFVTDLTYVNTAEMMWANFSVWLITGGLIMGVLAAIAGIVDFARNRRARRAPRPWFHSLLNIVVLVLGTVNAFIHSRDAYTSVMPTGILLSAIVAVLVIVSSWTGTSVAHRYPVGAA